ncbi:MaoC family dehydratase N-terminal domain-containing protein [Novosphingobium sp.]|uniref:FAS1-like dehydratase domain-containing protein n=1 Tax=Novosphingobium sp. TaxID=1874826 RepID=UPI0025DB1D35|nr:MaoC family dehydratase N-terminal domain-containing protein [Novosphingobium sp.]MCC6924456.1 MaoC family dehydratase N-terminal domain-containing protein [Novosphingobium sp.]
MNALDAWLGRSESRQDRIDSGHARHWLATLDRAAPGDGTLPQGFHWCLGLPDAPTAILGADGHPLRDDGPDSFLPPLSHLPRRMWASSKVEFVAPLRLGQTIERRSSVAKIEAKSGGSGELVFVTVEHQTLADGTLAVREEQSLVYRAAAAGDAPLAPPAPGAGRFEPADWHAHRTICPSEALLFRFSALTFNSHRIHYDLRYARDVERYRGLVVHGPLTATLLLDLARRELGDNVLARFAFRGLSPAICGEELNLALRKVEGGYELGAFASDGRQVASASAA